MSAAAAVLPHGRYYAEMRALRIVDQALQELGPLAETSSEVERLRHTLKIQAIEYANRLIELADTP